VQRATDAGAPNERSGCSHERGRPSAPWPASAQHCLPTRSEPLHRRSTASSSSSPVSHAATPSPLLVEMTIDEQRSLDRAHAILRRSEQQRRP